MIPIGGGMMEPETEETPKPVKDMYIGWWCLAVLLGFTAIGTFVALDVFGGLILLLLAFWAYYMVKNDSKEMSQQCMLSFVIMSVFQAIFELIPLCMNLPGRRKQTITPGAGHAGGGYHGGTSYTVNIETTPFFDESQGWHYMWQSYMMIISFVVCVIAAILAWVTYKRYPESLFDDNRESQSFGGRSSGGGQYSGSGASYGGGGGGGGGGGRAVGRSAPQTNLFGGGGQRLGGN